MGHINSLLIDMVRGHHGEEGVDRLFELAGVPRRAYFREVIYPEEEVQALFRAVQELYGVDDEAAQKAFADYFIAVSPRLFPAFFQVAGSARRMFEMVPVIHRQWPSAASARLFREKVQILSATDETVTFKYDSPNRLCGVLRHVARGVLEYYGEEGAVTETRCARNGAPWCEVTVRFGSP